MKKVLVYTLLLMVGFSATAQQADVSKPPYIRYPTVPSIQLLLGDSTSLFTYKNLPKNKKTIFMLFSPDCSHCQHTAEELVQQKDKLKDVFIVMATLQSITQMNAFVEKYGLKALPNLVVGKDIYFFMPSFYNVKNLPFLSFYNKKGALIRGFEGSMSVEKMLQQFN